MRPFFHSFSKIRNLWEYVPAEIGDRFLSMLPPWHAYERASEYFIFTCGVEQVYTTVKNLKVLLLQTVDFHACKDAVCFIIIRLLGNLISGAEMLCLQTTVST